MSARNTVEKILCFAVVLNLLSCCPVPRRATKDYDMKRLLIPASLIGAVLGLAIGFAVEKTSGPGHSRTFASWISWNGPDVCAWAVGGIIIGGAAAFMWRSNSSEALPRLDLLFADASSPYTHYKKS